LEFKIKKVQNGANSFTISPPAGNSIHFYQDTNINAGSRKNYFKCAISCEIMQILMPQFPLKEVSCITNHQYAINAVGKSLEWMED
jgi:hypothetical protein